MQLGAAAEQLAGHRSELVGLYFWEQATGSTYSAEEASALMDEYGWEGGWRIEDTAAQDIWNGGCPACQLQDVPVVFILETSTMRMVNLNPIGVEDVLEAVAAIDAVGG